MKHRKLVAWVFSASLFLFTVYAALDTFVLTRVYQTVEVTATGTASSNAGMDAEEAESETAGTQSSGKSRRRCLLADGSLSSQRIPERPLVRSSIA